ncbi:1-acyl-sn-glycerol-3-phosphate acyltransferase [Rhodoblastus acidophilus]|uniref:1-acyl-sn-glycerol-3-phosphate acyltransferase n=1 Tax=Rhodoblastus acidophilus TaxID=1074 RepID=A0A6N8DHI0_RHOAC|nr:lysophospholipid acyltransferase family protein [Rhodoblastus acidophilus]MCW2272756.1 1-acyl-sn-glycerol-3-phosphate acyltransferase [Rhodoblastus acidophilus]MTV29667.1 1-acyl-sn-glycerol-3-phosphate acyltransferase [Rhodoblastus acidophilus]
MPYLRALAFLLALTLSLIFAAPLQWLARRFDWPLQHRIQMAFCRVMLATIGIRVEAHGTIPGARPRFLVANHVSWTDILALASVTPLVFLAKKEVASWPVLGFLARLQGTVFVERENRRALPLVNAALSEKMRGGNDVVVFAEGTSSDGSSVLKFNAAHFAMLADMQAAGQSFTLAPVGIAYSRDVGWYGDMTFVPHLWSLMKSGGVVCRIFFGEAVATEGRDRKQLAAETETRVRDLLQAARSESPKNSR